MSQPRILVLSDVSVGYAVPQMLLMAKSIGALLNAKVTLVEPDMKGRLELAEEEGIEFRRISTRNPPHDLVFHVEYARAMNEIYRQIKPDVLLVFNAAVLPPLLLNADKPKCVIYYMLESLDHQIGFGGQHFFDLNRMASGLIDLVIVPERRRYAVDAARLGWHDLPTVEVLNIGSGTVPRRALPDRCRFLFAGTLNSHTGFDWMTDERLRDLQIDVAGPCDSQESRDLVAQFLSQSSGAQRRYLGLLPHRELLSRLHAYAYRLVFWSASDINTLYASPNKFFESISCGVPPISTPHPQMLEINRRYRCSIIASQFTRDAAVEAILDAEEIFYTEGYLRLLNGCALAAGEEINWPAQFKPVADFLAGRFPGAVQPKPFEQSPTEPADPENSTLAALWRNHRPKRAVNGVMADAYSDHEHERPSAAQRSTIAPLETADDRLDPEWYLETYPDVRMLGMTAREHFEWLGRQLGRFPNSEAADRAINSKLSQERQDSASHVAAN